MPTNAQRILAAIQKYGELMTLRRRIGTTTNYQSVTVKGIPRGYAPQELAGLLQQGDSHVTISNTEIAAQAVYAGPPKKGDFIVVDGASLAVQGNTQVKLSGVIVAHVLWVRG